MPKTRRPAKHKRYDLAAADAAQREAAMRELCASLSLLNVCRGKRCRRARACAVGADACFTRHWPLVSADPDMLCHAYIMTGAAGIERPEIEAKLDRQLQLCTDTRAKAPAEQSPRAPSPRVRVL